MEDLTEWLIADRVAGFALSSAEFHNEIGTIHSLWNGLLFLNAQVDHLQRTVQASPAGSTIGGFFSDLEGAFGLPPGANSLLPCFYHWFRTTVVNMTRMIGLLKGRQEGTLSAPPYESQAERKAVKNYCSTYSESVPEIAAVLVWRHKVFAHFAVTDPYANDNMALLQQVSFYPISYAQGLLTVGGFQIFVGSFDPASGQPPEGGSNLPSWAMTEVTANLQARYFWEVR